MTLLRQSWPGLTQDFHKTVQRIKSLSATLETDVELTRMRFDNQKYDQILSLMSSLNAQREESVPQKSYYVPVRETPRFWGREDIVALIYGALTVDGSHKSSLRSFALYGMGGVGKTQTALRYVNAFRDKYDAVLWFNAENTRTLKEGCSKVAETFGLIEPHSDTGDPSFFEKVKTWLSSTSKCYNCILP